jgi:hypothetical protein
MPTRVDVLFVNQCVNLHVVIGANQSEGGQS